MNIKQFRKFWQRNGPIIWLSGIGLVLVAWVLLYRLGLLTHGVSASEYKVATTPVGWHGLFNQPLELPLKLVRSVVYFVFPKHGAFLSRLPSAFFGGLSVVAFAWLLRFWHGIRTAVLATVLFASSAWVLHVSRLASIDALYLLALPALLLAHVALQRRAKQKLVVYAVLLTWSLLLTIPGLVGLVLWSLIWQKTALVALWQALSAWWQRGLAVLLGLLWLPVLALDVFHHHADLLRWLGLPSHFAAPIAIVKNIGLVFEQLFVRGPNNPVLWLGRTPLMDVFTLVACLLGIYFYVRHWRAGRARLLGGFMIIGAVLIGLGGPVSLSLLVPLLYILAATGIAYLLHEWLTVFPINPLARGLGIGLIMLAVALSSAYNLRAYFVAWPHNPATQAAFNRHL